MTRDEYLAAIRVIGQWEQDNDCDIEGRPMPPRHITALMDRIEATEADRILALKVESRAAYLQSLGWPSAPWTDGDHKRFADASDRWDGAYSKEYRADGLDFNRAILRPRSKGDRS